MIRKPFLLGISAFAAAAAMMAPAAAETSAFPLSDSFESASTEGLPNWMQAASDMAAVHYSPDLTEAEILQRVRSDAETLGVPLVRTFIVGRIAVMEASPGEMRNLLASAEGIPAVAVSSVYHPAGVKHTERLFAYTSRAMLTFLPTTTEAEKEAFYRENGFDRLKELPSGKVMVETNQQPGYEMTRFTEQLAAHSPLLENAQFDMAVSAETTLASDSVIIQDDFFDLQWYLDNRRSNSNFQEGEPDEDIDAPRAWMANRRAGAPFTFGSPNVVVGVLDTGIQVGHEDLAANIDPRGGFDGVDGGAPRPVDTLIGAHGTVMSGIVAADQNDRGIVGVGPDLRIYPIRVLGDDYALNPRDVEQTVFGAAQSATTLSIVSGVQTSVFEGIDVNLHSYTLGIPDVSEAGDIETALRESFESGRGGLGTTNIAAAGNYYSQVEYPASSFWTIAVGSQSIQGNVVDQSNWGGVGVDFVMPSHSPRGGGTGVLSTDLIQDVGLGIGDSSLEGNEEGQYAANGSLFDFPTFFMGQQNVFERFYGGSSYAAALTAGMVGMMLSDSRYDELSPFQQPSGFSGGFPAREVYRTRAPLRPNDSFIMSKLMNFADVPKHFQEPFFQFSQFENPEILNQLDFPGQYNERLGMGRPNVARAVAAPEGLPAADKLFQRFILPEPLISWQWGMKGEIGLNEDADNYEDFTQGWSPAQGETLEAVLATDAEEAEPVTISPYLEAVRFLYFEDGTVEDSLSGEAPGFFYVWTDSVSTAPEGSESAEITNNLVYNPDGQYPRNQTIGLVSPDTDFATTTARQLDLPSTTPMVMEIQLAHALGVENVSDVGGTLEGDPTVPNFEIDEMKISIIAKGEGGAQTELDVGRLTGDSATGAKVPLETATVVNISDDGIDLRPGFRAGSLPVGGEYRPLLPLDQFLIRKYRYLVPPLPPGFDKYQVKISLDSGPSYLPVWFVDVTTDDPPRQMFEVRRDHRGFMLYSVSMFGVNPQYAEYLDFRTYTLGDGFYPTYTVSTNDVLATQPTPGGGDFLTVLDPEPRYVTEPGLEDPTLQSTTRRNFLRLTESANQITGMKANPVYELLAFTSQGPTGDGVHISTTDGVNVTDLVDPALGQGAREPNWSPDGNQLLYASEDYLRVASFQPDGSVKVETIFGEDHPFLTDFRSPVFGSQSSLVYFSARRKDATPDNGIDQSLNVYATMRNGRIQSYEFNDGIPGPILRGWEGIDVYDLDLTPDGQRLMFVASATQAPQIEEGTLISSAVPNSSGSFPQIFINNNLRFVTTTNADADYTQVPLKTDPDFDAVDQSVRWPRFQPGFGPDEIVWVGFNSEMTADTNPRLGRVQRQPIEVVGPGAPDDIVPTPQPTTPAPTATPPPPNNGQVTQTADVTFAATDEGWSFNPGGFLENPLLSEYERINTEPRTIDDGVVGLLAGSETEVTQQDTRVATLNFVARRTGTFELGFLSGQPRPTRTQNVVRQDLPTTSGVTAGALAGLTGELPARVYLDTPTVTVRQGDLLQVKVRLDPNDQPVHVVEAYVTFDPEALRLDLGQVNANVFGQSLSEGLIRLTSNETNNVFGFWESPNSVVQVRQDSLFLYRAIASATPGTPDEGVPTLRLRANSQNLESAFTVETDSFGDRSLSPVSSARRAVDLLFRPPRGLFDAPPRDRNYLLSFDLLNFLPGSIDPNGGLMLHDVELYRFDYQGKHYALWGFELPNRTSINFTAVGTSGIDGDLTLALRRCCTERAPDAELCASGSLLSGVNLNTTSLAPGFYTLVAQVDKPEEVLLTFNSSAPLLGNIGDECGTSTRQITDAGDACRSRTPLSGTGGQPSIVRTFFDGTGFFPDPPCAPTPNETVVKSSQLVREFDLGQQPIRDLWTTGPETNPFTDPRFVETDLSLALAVDNRNQTFGFWNIEDIGLSPAQLETDEDSPVVVFRATYRLVMENAGNRMVNPLDMPDLRVRLATNEFQRSVSALLISLADGSTVPVPGTPRELEVFMVLEEVPESLEGLIAAFDVLSFYPESQFPNRRVTPEPIELEFVRIERIDIPDYPPTR